MTDLRSGRIAQGGSTLTQQLVKLTITGNSRTLDRKLREAIYAVELERRYSKNEILQYYLNQAYFGEGVYGIATAAQHYFGNSSIKFVTLGQAASLAATIAAPERFKPTAKKANKDRRNLVLDRMLELGMATPKEVAKAKKENIKVKRYTPRRQPYFERYIVNQLPERPQVQQGPRQGRHRRAQAQGVPGRPAHLHHPPAPQAGHGRQRRPGPDGPVPRRPGRGAGQRRAQHGPDRRPVRGPQPEARSTWPPPRAAPASSRGRRSRCSSSWPPWRRASRPGSSCPARPRSPSPTAAATGYNQPWTPGRRRLQRRDLQHVRGHGQLGEHLVRPARGQGRPRAGGRGGPPDGHHQHPAPQQQGLRLLERLLAGPGARRSRSSTWPGRSACWPTRACAARPTRSPRWWRRASASR